MSTFNGIITEFPDIRVDFFRRSPNPNHRPPLACFLSHVHSDHLAGLESLRSPFVYCSAATREILLRLERYPCRINFAKGILEARVQTFKSLHKLLKPMPLETPTTLELAPGNHIQVTLFDANHCPGAVMFLFEADGKAVLYTGDVRSEPWFVSSIARSPSLVQYTFGSRTIDKIYLDTSFVDNVPFQSKAEGIAELIGKVALYPPGTIFHLQAWTYGYEDVFVALSKALGSQVHVDHYKMSIYSSLKSKPFGDSSGAAIHLSPEAPALTGFKCGNTEHPGCLTTNENVRIHCCEKGNYCSIVKQGPVVWIHPIVAHLDGGVDRLEVGVGGGGDDLEREAELDSLSAEELAKLLGLLSDATAISLEAQAEFQGLLHNMTSGGRKIPLDLAFSSFGINNETHLHKAIDALAQTLHSRIGDTKAALDSDDDQLPKTITFPYSRHSSYPELCHLVATFRPKDVWPCTEEPRDWMRRGISIHSLFGPHCSGDVFEYDLAMEILACDPLHGLEISQSQQGKPHTQDPDHYHHEQALPEMSIASPAPNTKHTFRETDQSLRPQLEPNEHAKEKRGGDDQADPTGYVYRREPEHSESSQASKNSDCISFERADAHQIMIRNLAGGEWVPISLLSTSNNHTLLERDPGTSRELRSRRKDFAC